VSNLRIDFDWDPDKARSNRTKHDVSFESAMTVFSDPFAATIFDNEHSEDEERWVTLGESAGGALLVVIHTWVETSADYARVRIISARRATRRETGQYREGRNDETGI
jgi:uncharacterized DUF497 family protein